MKQIWKFLASPGTTYLETPAGAEFLTAQTQGKQLVLWAKVDPEAPRVPQPVRIWATGWDLPHDIHLTHRYLSTVQFPEYAEAWHVFVPVHPA